MNEIIICQFGEFRLLCCRRYQCCVKPVIPKPDVSNEKFPAASQPHCKQQASFYSGIGHLPGVLQLYSTPLPSQFHLAFQTEQGNLM